MTVLTRIEIANMITDERIRHLWIQAGMPTDLEQVTAIVLDVHRAKALTDREPQLCEVY